MPKFKANNTTKLQRKAQNYVITAYKFISGAKNEDELNAQMDFVKNSIAALNKMTAVLSKPGEDGSIPRLDEEKVKALRKQYKDAMKHCARLKASASAGPDKNPGLFAMMESLGAMISKDFKTLQNYDARISQTLPGLIEQSHMAKITVEGEGTRLGGSQNTRLAMEVAQPDGTAVKGVFTESKVHDPDAAVNTFIQKMHEKYPQYRDVTDRITAGYGKDRKTMFRHISEMLVVLERSAEVRYYGEKNDPLSEAAGDLFDDPEAYEYFSYLIKSAEAVSSVFLIGEDMLHLEKGAPVDVRNNVFSAGASFFGFEDLVARSVSAEVQLNGKTVKGSFMDFAEGFDISTAKPQDLAGIDRNSFETVSGKVSVANLGALDFIFGNVDRTSLNMLYRFGGEDGKQFLGVTAIDNDSSFGVIGKNVLEGNGVGRLAGIDEIPFVTQKMADAIEQTTPEMFAMMLAENGLSAKEIKATCDRLEMIRERLDRSPLSNPNEKPALERGVIKVMTDEQIGKFTRVELAKVNKKLDCGIWRMFSQGVIELEQRKNEIAPLTNTEFAAAQAGQKAEALDFAKLSAKLKLLAANLDSANHGLFISSHQYDRVLAVVKNAQQEFERMAQVEAAGIDDINRAEVRRLHEQTAGELMAGIHNAASAYLFNKEYIDGTMDNNARSAKRFAKVTGILSFAENYVDRMDVSDRLYFRNAREDEKFELAKARGDLGRKFRELVASRNERQSEAPEESQWTVNTTYLDCDDHIGSFFRQLRSFAEFYEATPSTDGDLQNVSDEVKAFAEDLNSALQSSVVGQVNPNHKTLGPAFRKIKADLAAYRSKVASGEARPGEEINDAVEFLNDLIQQNDSFITASIKGYKDTEEYFKNLSPQAEADEARRLFEITGIEGHKPAMEDLDKLKFGETPLVELFDAMLWMQAQEGRIGVGALKDSSVKSAYRKAYDRLMSEYTNSPVDIRIEFYKLIKRHDQSLAAEVNKKHAELNRSEPDGPDKEKRVLQKLYLEESYVNASHFLNFKNSNATSFGSIEIMGNQPRADGANLKDAYPDVQDFIVTFNGMEEKLESSIAKLRTYQALGEIGKLKEAGYVPEDAFMSDELVAAKRWYFDLAEKLPEYGVGGKNIFSLGRLKIDNDLDYAAYRKLRNADSSLEIKEKFLEHIENSTSYALMPIGENGRNNPPLADGKDVGAWMAGNLKPASSLRPEQILRLYRAAKENKLYIQSGEHDEAAYKKDRMIFVGNDGMSVVTDGLGEFVSDKAIKEKKYEKYGLNKEQADKIYENHMRLNKMLYDLPVNLVSDFEELDSEEARKLSERAAKTMAQDRLMDMSTKTPQFLKNSSDFETHGKAFYTFSIDPGLRTAEENALIEDDLAVTGSFKVIDGFLKQKYGDGFKLKNIEAADENGVPFPNETSLELYRRIAKCMYKNQEFYVGGELYAQDRNGSIVEGLGLKSYGEQLAVLAQQVRKKGASDGPGAADYQSFASELLQLPAKLKEFDRANGHSFENLQSLLAKTAESANAFIQKAKAKEGKLSSKELNAIKQVNRFLDINDKVIAKDKHPELDSEFRIAEKIAVYSAQQKANSKNAAEAAQNRELLFNREKRVSSINNFKTHPEFIQILGSSKVWPTDLLKMPAEKLYKSYSKAHEALGRQQNQNPRNDRQRESLQPAGNNVGEQRKNDKNPVMNV